MNAKTVAIAAGVVTVVIGATLGIAVLVKIISEKNNPEPSPSPTPGPDPDPEPVDPDDDDDDDDVPKPGRIISLIFSNMNNNLTLSENNNAIFNFGVYSPESGYIQRPSDSKYLNIDTTTRNVLWSTKPLRINRTMKFVEGSAIMDMFTMANDPKLVLTLGEDNTYNLWRPLIAADDQNFEAGKWQYLLELQQFGN